MPFRSLPQRKLRIRAGESGFIHELANDIVTVVRNARADASKVGIFICVINVNFNYGCKYQFISTVSILWV